MKDSPTNQIDTLLARHHNGVAGKEKTVILDDLIALYKNVADNDQTKAQEIRQTFLYTVEREPGILSQEQFSRFLAEHIKPEDFAHFRWETPHHVISFCERLYSVEFQTEAVADHVGRHIGNLLRHALQQFELRGEYEKMFQLLRLTPVSSTMSDGELLRLRNVAYMYEMRRVHRNRRWLYGYLIAQIFLVALVFPLLFIYAENGLIQRQVEEAVEGVANLELSDPTEEHQFLTYQDGLYWSFITAGSIGYGDITPKTQVGKGIAAMLGVMGVITAGVIAGLILQWITIRRFD